MPGLPGCRSARNGRRAEGLHKPGYSSTNNTDMKREMLNHFKVRLRGDMESFMDQIGLLECEKEGLES